MYWVYFIYTIYICIYCITAWIPPPQQNNLNILWLLTKSFAHFNISSWFAYSSGAHTLSARLVGWFLWHINLCRLFNAKSIFMQIVLFQTIQFSTSTQFVKTFLFHAIQFSQAVLIQFSISRGFVYTQLNVKTVLYYMLWSSDKTGGRTTQTTGDR